MAVAGFRGVSPTSVTSAPGPQRPTGGALNNAIAGAKKFKDTLGLPNYTDLLNQFGGGQGTREYGNAGAATAGANLLHGDMDRWRSDLQGQQANIAAARAGVRNPTGTEGFQNVARLNAEKLGRAASQADRAAADAAGRRGYAGGYDPGATEFDRLSALGEANASAAIDERKAQQDLFSGENSLYGNMMPGYTSALAGYTDLTKTAAELPTKYLDSYASLLGSLSPNFGSIFGTAMEGAKFDQNREGSLLDQKYGLGQKEADAAEQRRRDAAEFDFQQQQKHAPIAAQTGKQIAGIADPRQAFLERQQRAGRPTYR